MSQIVITHKRIVKEILILGMCFIAAFVINAVSIIIFQTKWSELFTTLHYTAFLSFILYVIVVVFRFLMSLFKRLFKSKSKS